MLIHNLPQMYKKKFIFSFSFPEFNAIHYFCPAKERIEL